MMIDRYRIGASINSSGPWAGGGIELVSCLGAAPLDAHPGSGLHE
jgi:hypothetical protein